MANISLPQPALTANDVNRLRGQLRPEQFSHNVTPNEALATIDRGTAFTLAKIMVQRSFALMELDHKEYPVVFDGSV